MLNLTSFEPRPSLVKLNLSTPEEALSVLHTPKIACENVLNRR